MSYMTSMTSYFPYTSTWYRVSLFVVECGIEEEDSYRQSYIL